MNDGDDLSSNADMGYLQHEIDVQRLRLAPRTTQVYLDDTKAEHACRVDC
jgi:hypothetical protein